MTMNVLAYGVVTAMTVAGASFAVPAVTELFSVQKDFVALAQSPEGMLSRSADAKLCALQARALAVAHGAAAQAGNLSLEQSPDVQAGVATIQQSVDAAQDGMVPAECRALQNAGQ